MYLDSNITPPPTPLNLFMVFMVVYGVYGFMGDQYVLPLYKKGVKGGSL